MSRFFFIQTGINANNIVVSAGEQSDVASRSAFLWQEHALEVLPEFFNRINFAAMAAQEK